MREPSGEMGIGGRDLDRWHPLIHHVKRMGGVGLVGLAAMLLMEPPFAGHAARAVEPRELKASASSGKTGANFSFFPDGPPRPGRPETESSARNGVSGPSATLVACAADITSAGSTIEYWTTALKDKDPHVRSQAATALGETRNGAAVPALI